MRVPPTLCTMHLGAPVVPLEYMMKRGCENGTCKDRQKILNQKYKQVLLVTVTVLESQKCVTKTDYHNMRGFPAIRCFLGPKYCH